MENDDFRAGVRIVAGFLAFVVLILGLTWLVQGNQFFLYQYFAPKQAEVERKVFEETESYNKGMIQELQNMRFQYEQASPESKEALASIILHRVDGYDESKLPADLKEFVAKLRAEHNTPSNQNSKK